MKVQQKKKASSTAKPAAVRRNAQVKTPATRKKAPATGQVLKELKSLAKDLNKAARGLSSKTSATDPKAISAILGSVERMMAEAATKSLMEAESAKQILGATRDSLAKDWNRKDIEGGLQGVSGHLTNIIVAQEFQDLAGQAIRKAMKALVGAIVIEAGEDKRLSQIEVDGLLKGLMP